MLCHFFMWMLKRILCCEGLKKKKEGFETELEELGSIREMQLRESEASGKISGLEKKIQYAEIEKVNQMINLSNNTFVIYVVFMHVWLFFCVGFCVMLLLHYENHDLFKPIRFQGLDVLLMENVNISCFIYAIE